MAKTTDDKPEAPKLQKNTPQVELGRPFRDRVYTSRTLIFPDGSVLPVAKGLVSAVSDDQLQYLDSHPDFVRLTE